MNALRLFVLLWLVSAGAWADTLRVASYNLENYLSMDRMVNGQWRVDYPKPEQSRRALQQIIVAANADILAVQEIGDMRFLLELQRDLKALGLDYPHAFLGQGVDRVRHVAVLSRREPVSVVRHDDLSFPYLGGRRSPQRGLLEVRFPGFALYVVHLKSRFTNDQRDFESAEYREKEARVIRDRIRDQEGQGDGIQPYLVVGDFNDLINSAPLRRFFSVSNRDLAHPLDLRDARGMVWTYFWERGGQYGRVDYILASGPMLRAWERAGRQGAIFDHPQEMEASDHRLIWAEFSLESVRKAE